MLENWGGQSYITIRHNTIMAVGNPNAVALQGPSYSHLSITDNYLSGFGYTVNIGRARGPACVTLDFYHNTFGTEIAPVYGPLYGWSPGIGSNHWSCNRLSVVAGTT